MERMLSVRRDSDLQTSKRRTRYGRRRYRRTCPPDPRALRHGVNPSGPPAAGLSALRERLLDVGEQVVHVLAAGREADEALGDVVRAPARPPLGAGVDAAEAGRLG